LSSVFDPGGLCFVTVLLPRFYSTGPVMDPTHPDSTSAVDPVERLLARRRRLRQIGFLTVGLLLASVLLTHGSRNGPADDWAAFDRKRATVLSVSVDGSLVVRVADGTQSMVRPLGVDFPAKRAATQAGRYLAGQALGAEVTLRLEQPQTRSEDGALLAYLFLTDTDNLNLDLIRDGQAFADRRVPHAFKAQFEQAEADARRKGRGMWKDLSDDQMPAWRQEWVKQMQEKQRRVEGRR
jgi:endonuclease YncB( thermonuclease family)